VYFLYQQAKNKHIWAEYYYQNKVKNLEKRLQRKPGCFVPSRFNHLKHFLSKESQDNDFENGLNYILNGGDSNGK
jgi:hypothetical protein